MDFELTGSTVLITGGASGMGFLYAQRALKEGAQRIILWDRNVELLKQAQKQLDSEAAQGGSAVVIETDVIDLSDLESISGVADQVLQRAGAPDLLINNAGIVAGNAYFWESDSFAQTLPTMQINTLAPMLLSRAFLPAMMEPGRERRILNIASAAATVSNPRMSVYAASKWALYGWSDSLRLELESSDARHLRVTTFCPSYVSTGMFEGAKGMLFTPIMTPQQAVNAAWKAMKKGKAVKLAPWGVGLAKSARGVLPLTMWDSFARFSGVYRSMEHFTGRRPQ